MTLTVSDYEENITNESIEIWNKIKMYLDLASDLGDVAYMEKPKEITIRIRLKKKSNEPKDIKPSNT